MAGPGQHFPMSVSGSMPGTQMMSGQGSVGTTSFTQSQTSQMAGLPHQQSFPATGAQGTPPTQTHMMSPTKSVNSVSLCKLGQDTNQELVTKLLEVFKQFKTMQLPNGTNNQQCHERRAKIEESLRQMSMVFKKLRLVYDKVSELIIDPEENPEEVLVPLKGDPLEEKMTSSDAYKYSSEENKQLVEQLQMKNRQLKDIIDKTRTIMWEINTMIVMRKT